jgi:FdhE protein
MVRVTMGTLRERAQELKEKRPGYGDLLDFYVAVREAQDASCGSVQVDPARAGKNGLGAGSSLVEKEDLHVDRESAARLFRTLCRLGHVANPHLAEKVEKIDSALRDGAIDLNELLAEDGNERSIERAAVGRGLDVRVLTFLVQSSIRPSIEAGREQLLGMVDRESWRKTVCPVCGSLPALSLLRGEGGMRYSLCSYCGCEWRVDRLSCSVCGNKEQSSLQYFYGEGEEALRIDLCDACHHYIKTIDHRCLEGSDAALEDLATLHLDVLAVQKGYLRAIPNPWTT